MRLINILKHIIKEYWESNNGDTVWVDDHEQASYEDLAKEHSDVKLFFDTIGVPPENADKVWLYFYDNSKTLINKSNPFEKGTWPYYIWYIYWLEFVKYSDNYEECKKNRSLRRKYAKLAEKIHPEISIEYGDDDC